MTSNNNKEVRELLKKAASQGFMIVEGRHYKIYNTNGQMVSVPRTPGDHRSIANAVRYLKQIGYKP